MKKLGHLESYKMELTTVTPIYIGGGEDSALNGLQYYFDTNTKTLNIVDEAKFSKFLVKNNLLDNFMDFILKEKNPKLFKWLESSNLINKKPDIFSKSQVLNSANVKNLNDIKLFVRNFDNKAYIAGSSIKGAIRTALLSSLIRQNKEKYMDKYWKDIEQALISGDKRTLSKLCDRIESDIFSMNKFKSAQTDSRLRGLQVSDTNGVPDTNLYFAQKEDLSVGKQKISSIPLWREYLSPQTKFNFIITIDTKVFPYGIKGINTALKNYANYINNMMDNYDNLDIANIYLPNETDDDINPNLCIGGGTGFLTKTIIYQIAPDNDTAKRAVAKYLDKTFTKRDKYSGNRVPQHKHVVEDLVLSPRALKLAKEQDDYLVVGWCYIDEVKE